VAPIFVEPNGQNRIWVVKGANDRLMPADVDAAAEVIRVADYVVLQLEIPDETVRQRAATAGRQSDSPKIIEQRIKDYHREFDMISVYYPNAKIVKIDGTKSEELMWKDMQQALNQWGLRPVTK
jgi:sugar/nucleoside kinase (ribokinase family)